MPRWLPTAAVVVAAAAAALGPLSAEPAEWTERYFGVGSAGDRDTACGLARDHAQGNSFDACLGRSGTRSHAAYTDCVCAVAGEGIHVCNVNLKVLCDRPQSAGGGDRGQRTPGGEPKGRADRSRSPHLDAEGAPGRPGLEAEPSPAAF